MLGSFQNGQKYGFAHWFSNYHLLKMILSNKSFISVRDPKVYGERTEASVVGACLVHHGSKDQTPFQIF